MIISGIKVRTGERHYTYAWLMLDDLKINEAHGRNFNIEYIACSSTNSVLLRCNAGSKVWLRTRGTYTKIYGESNSKTTTFSGFLVK